MRRIAILLLALVLMSGASSCQVECNDGTKMERNGKGQVVCRDHGGEKVKVGW